jgi:hypothetical protein
LTWDKSNLVANWISAATAMSAFTWAFKEKAGPTERILKISVRTVTKSAGLERLSPWELKTGHFS